jgi:hypothetical protein
MSSLVYSLRGRLRRVDQEKLWTYILTTILVLSLYLVVRQITLPEPRFDVEKFAEIDFTRFQPPKPEKPEPEKKPTEKVAEEAAPSTTAPEEIPEIDLEALKEMANLVDPSKDFTPLERMATLPQSMQMPDINVGTNILPPLNAPVVQNRPGGLPVLGTPSNVYNPNLEASKVGYGGTPGGPGYATGRKDGVKGRKAVDSGIDKVDVKKITEADLKKYDFEKLFLELLAWLRRHQAELTPTLKRYMRYKPGDVTAKVSISAGETGYDLFFLCNEHSQDIGLLLVAEGDSTEAIFLRDQGFRKTSFFLQVGIAGRNEEDEVVSVSMQERRPTTDQISRFYGIFLSWWEKNKPRGEKKS